MMEPIKSWAFSVCSAAICGGLLNMILPEGSAQKTYKIVFCMFFLGVIIAPLSEIEIPDFNSIAEKFSENETEEIYQNEFTENSADYIKKRIISDTKAILSEEGISAKDISVKVNISENGGIDINKFVISFSNIESSETLEEKIFKKTGIRPEIIISEEN